MATTRTRILSSVEGRRLRLDTRLDGPARISVPPRGTYGILALAVGLPLAAIALGTAALFVSRAGAHDRPVLAIAVLLLGAVAGFIPFRYGLPIAVVLSAFNGFLADFVGDHALYWNELFAAVVVARSVAAKRPSRREVQIAAVLGAVYAGYLLTGTSLRASVWGAKVLLLSAVIGWAVARSRVRMRDWRAIYCALVAVVGASIILAAWQRSEGIKGLSDLGLAYGTRIRETAGGSGVRAFAGFTSAAPLSYALVIAVCCWAAFALGGRDRKLVLATAWVLPAAAAGIYMAVDRTALIGLVAALFVVALAYRRKVFVSAAALAAVALAILVSVEAPRHFDSFKSAAQARFALWGEYLSAVEPFGAGPATAGSAYAKVAPAGWVRPFQVPQFWRVTYSGMRASGEQAAIVETRLARRPPLELFARLQAVGRPERLIVTLGNDPTSPEKTLVNRTIPSDRPIPVRMRIPGTPNRQAPLGFTLRQVGAPDSGAQPAGELDIRDLRIQGLPKPRTRAERIWQRWFERTPAALQSDGPGLVDNLYVSWSFQYGILGLGLCAAWLGVLLWPTVRRQRGSPGLAAALVGVFLVVSAAAVNIWEEAPTDLLAALVFAIAFAASRTPTKSPATRRTPAAS